MRRHVCFLFFLATLLAVWPLAASGAQPHTFVEDFANTQHMDAAHTNAHWDTGSGRLKLPVTEPAATGSLNVLSNSLTDFPAVYVPERGRAYLIGGLCPPLASPPPRSNQILEYDPTHNLVERVMGAHLPTARDGCAAAYAASARKVYIFGGADQQRGYRDILEFDPFADTLTLLPIELPYRLQDAATVYASVNDKIYILGGINPDRISADILEFDVATRSLHTLPAKLPSGRVDACAAYANSSHTVYLFGGRSPTATMAEILAFDVLTQQISVLSTRLPVGMQGSACAYLPAANQVMILGGQETGGRAPTRTQVFDVASGSLSQCTDKLPGNGMWDGAAIYAPESDWLVYLGGFTSEQAGARYVYPGLLRLRWDGTRLRSSESFLPSKTASISAVYAPLANQAYLFGGESNTILRFDLDSASIITMSATLPVTCSDPGAVWVPSASCAYVFAGSGVYRYDPSADTLTTQPAHLPSGFDPRVAVYAEARQAVYLFDSANGSGAILRYDLADGSLVTLSAHWPTPRRAAYGQYVAATNQIVLLGGWDYQNARYLDQIVLFDVTSESMAPLTTPRLPMPGEFKALTYVPATGSLYLLGGWGGWSETSSFAFDKLWQFDPVAQTFVTSTLGLPAMGRQAAIWASAEDHLYAFGGLTKVGSLARVPSERVQRYDLGHLTLATAQSTALNTGDAVLRATLSATQQLNGGNVEYALSNDGGATWQAVTPGVECVFAASGTDLRWHAVLHGDGLHSPTLDQLQLTWSAEAPADTPTPTQTLTPSAATPTATPTITPTPTPSGPVEVSVTIQKGAFGTSEDTYIYQYAPGANYCNATTLKVGYKQQNAALLRFDLASIPSHASVLQAELQVYAAGWDGSGANLTLEAYAVLRNVTLCQSTWNVAQTGNPWAGLGCSNTGSDRRATPESRVTTSGPRKWYGFPLTALVQSWVSGSLPNNGVLLRATNPYGSAFFAFASDSASQSTRPKLVLRYRTE